MKLYGLYIMNYTFGLYNVMSHLIWIIFKRILSIHKTTWDMLCICLFLKVGSAAWSRYIVAIATFMNMHSNEC